MKLVSDIQVKDAKKDTKFKARIWRSSFSVKVVNHEWTGDLSCYEENHTFYGFYVLATLFLTLSFQATLKVDFLHHYIMIDEIPWWKFIKYTNGISYLEWISMSMMEFHSKNGIP